MSNDTFSVGEIAQIRGLVNMTELNGMECEVIGGLALYAVRVDEFHPHGDKYGYRVRIATGSTGIIYPHNLRKRRPPQDWVKLCRLNDIPREVTHV